MFNELNELKTIEIDIENRVFKVNGEDFGCGCDGFRIECDTRQEGAYKIYVEINSRLKFVGSFDLRGKSVEMKKNNWRFRA